MQRPIPYPKGLSFRITQNICDSIQLHWISYVPYMHFWFMVKYYIVQPLKKGKQNLGKAKIRLWHITT